MPQKIRDLEQHYRAAMAAADNAPTKDEKIARLEDAMRIAQHIERLRKAVSHN